MLSSFLKIRPYSSRLPLISPLTSLSSLIFILLIKRKIRYKTWWFSVSKRQFPPAPCNANFFSGINNPKFGKFTEASHHVLSNPWNEYYRWDIGSRHQKHKIRANSIYKCVSFRRFEAGDITSTEKKAGNITKFPGESTYVTRSNDEFSSHKSSDDVLQGDWRFRLLHEKSDISRNYFMRNLFSEKWQHFSGVLLRPENILKNIFRHLVRKISFNFHK